jgi:hypothetical protein
MIAAALPPVSSAPLRMAPPSPTWPPPTFFTTATVEGVHGVTDTGRTIPLMRYEAVSILPAGQQLRFAGPEDNRRFLAALEQKFLENTKQDLEAVCRLMEPFPESNCHGWLLTGGKYGVCDELLPTILADNGYVTSESAADGDLVVCMHLGQVKHSGIVRVDASGTLFVESKWGPFGVYLHGIDKHPFAKTMTFYRSPRPGHLLTLASGSGDAGQ